MAFHPAVPALASAAIFSLVSLAAPVALAAPATPENVASARALYNDFTSSCLAAGCHKMKAITTAGNEGSLRFHLALGWTATEDENYAGPNRRRMVLTRTL